MCIRDSTCIVHDLEDGIGAGLLDASRLQAVAIWRCAAEGMGAAEPLAAVRRPILDRLQRELLQDVASASAERIVRAGVTCLQDVRACPTRLIDFSPDRRAELVGLEQLLAEAVYRHPRVAEMDERAGRLVRKLFEAYVDRPAELPERFRRRIDQHGLHRVVCDYIAGMTDRYCHQQCQHLGIEL